MQIDLNIAAATDRTGLLLHHLLHEAKQPVAPSAHEAKQTVAPSAHDVNKLFLPSTVHAQLFSSIPDFRIIRHTFTRLILCFITIHLLSIPAQHPFPPYLLKSSS